MAQARRAVVFYARDFLRDVLPGHAPDLPEGLARVYLVTKKAEARAVRERDPEGEVVELGGFLDAAKGAPGPRDATFHEMRARTGRDRFLRRMRPAAVDAVVDGTRAMLDHLGTRHDVRFSLDEPVSGFVNDSLHRWVRDQGGTPFHYQYAWLPGHTYVVRGSAQRDPVAFDTIEGGRALVDAHVENRLVGRAAPNYVRDYSTTARTLRDAAKIAGKGLFRRLRPAETYIDADPMPHDLHAAGLIASLRFDYGGVAAARALPDPRLVIFPMHYEPEAVLSYFSDTHDFHDQPALMRTVLSRLPEGAHLAIKEHPSQPGQLGRAKWRDVVADPRVIAVKGTDSMPALLEMPSAMITVGSSAGMEALMRGRHVYTFGNPHYRDMPGVTHVPDPETLEVDFDAPGPTRAEVVAAYGDFVSRFCVPGEFLPGRSGFADPGAVFARLLDAADAPAAAS